MELKLQKIRSDFKYFVDMLLFKVSIIYKVQVYSGLANIGRVLLKI